MSDSQAVKRVAVKRLPGFVLYDDGAMLFEDLRCDFPHVCKLKEWKKKDGTIKKTYSIALLLPKTKVKIKELIDAQIVKTWQSAKGGAKPPSDKLFIRDGDELGDPNYEGHWRMNASETRRPSVRGPKKEVLGESDQGMFYGGCWVSALIRPWYGNFTEGGKQVNANLLAVQFRKGCPDEERFGGVASQITDAEIDEAFSEVPDEDDEI